MPVINITVNINVGAGDALSGFSVFTGDCPMTVVSSFDLLEGEDQHITIKDQGGRALLPSAVTFTPDAAIGANLTIMPDPAGGFVVHAVAECSGKLTVKATRGSQSVSHDFPVNVSAALTDFTIETP